MAINMQAQAVAADMDRLFRPIAGRAAAALSATEADRGGHRRRGLRWAAFGVPVVLAVGGAALSFNYVGDAWRVPTAPTKAVAPATSPARPSIAPPPAATDRMAAPGAVPSGVGTGGQAMTELAAADRAGLSPEGRPASEPSYGDTPDARTATTTSPRAASYRSPADAAPRQRRQRRANGNASDCAPGSLRDQCIYQDVLTADGRLRRAYERARQDGVSSRELTEIGRSWRKARNRAEDDPDGTIRRYEQLADALDDLRRGPGQ